MFVARLLCGRCRHLSLIHRLLPSSKVMIETANIPLLCSCPIPSESKLLQSMLVADRETCSRVSQSHCHICHSSFVIYKEKGQPCTHSAEGCRTELEPVIPCVHCCTNPGSGVEVDVFPLARNWPRGSVAVLGLVSCGVTGRPNADPDKAPNALLVAPDSPCAAAVDLRGTTPSPSRGARNRVESDRREGETR